MALLRVVIVSLCQPFICERKIVLWLDEPWMISAFGFDADIPFPQVHLGMRRVVDGRAGDQPPGIVEQDLVQVVVGDARCPMRRRRS